MTTYKLKGAANITYNNSEGVAYVADAYGVVTVTAPYTFQTIMDLVNAGCTPLGQIQALSNYGATTAPTVANDNTQDYGAGSRWLNVTTGVEYVAVSVATGAAVWARVGSSGTPPWITGSFYGTPAGSTQAAVLTVLGTLYAYPVFVPSKVTLSSINVSVTTGQTGGKFRGALYYDAAGYPGAIVPGTDTGDLAATGTAVVTKGSLTAVLAPGIYWFASIATASSTMPSVIGATATYADSLSSFLGFDTAAHALATSGEAATGFALTGQTYPATSMTVSFPTFPASAALALGVTTPIAAFGV